ncbi:MAG: hypothetical protein NVS2B16_28230 [Chloroflexota bacterium]
MKRLGKGFGIAVLLSSVHMQSASASTHRQARAQASTVPVTFRLRAADAPSTDTTFWVAYGPVGGRFGIARLHAAGNHMYTARVLMPINARSIFAYLAGHGSITTRFGPAPGDPVQTVKQVGPVAVVRLRSVTTEWHAPIG